MGKLVSKSCSILSMVVCRSPDPLPASILEGSPVGIMQYKMAGSGLGYVRLSQWINRTCRPRRPSSAVIVHYTSSKQTEEEPNGSLIINYVICSQFCPFPAFTPTAYALSHTVAVVRVSCLLVYSGQAPGGANNGVRVMVQ